MGSAALVRVPGGSACSVVGRSEGCEWGQLAHPDSGHTCPTSRGEPGPPEGGGMGGHARCKGETGRQVVLQCPGAGRARGDGQRECHVVGAEARPSVDFLGSGSGQRGPLTLTLPVCPGSGLAPDQLTEGMKWLPDSERNSAGLRQLGQLLPSRGASQAGGVCRDQVRWRYRQTSETLQVQFQTASVKPMSQ